jgi:hypothetical protein
MNKLLAGFSFAFIALTIISFMVEGQGGLAATRLTTDLSKTATTAIVASTNGFLAADLIRISDEYILYTGKTSTTFTGLIRGDNNTTAGGYTSGTRVYNRSTSVVNQMLGFNVSEAMSTVGPVDTVKLLKNFFFESLPKIIMWNYSFLEGELYTIPLAYFKYMLYPLSIGFIITMFTSLISIFFGIARLFV